MTVPWLKDRIAHHTLRLVVLSKLPASAPVVCPICQAATARSVELCGCGGTVTVAEARDFHLRELAVLDAEGVKRC